MSWFVFGLGVVMIGTTVVSAVAVDRCVTRRVIILTSAAAIASLAPLFATVEIAAALLPRAFLPPAIGRLSVEVAAGPGLWLALATSGAILVTTALPETASGLSSRIPALWWWPHTRTRAAAGAAIAATVVVGVARYLPWVDATAGTHHIRVEGWAIPWLGPLSLLALWTMGGALLVALMRRSTAALLAVAAAAWLVSFFSALAILATGTFARLRVDERLPPELRRFKPSVGHADGAIVAYGSSLVLAAVIATLVPMVERGRSNRD